MRELHLGCGSVHLSGFENIDITWRPGVDKVADIRYLPKREYLPQSVDLIYASHVLEHFNKWEYKCTLSRWYEILKINGVLRLAVPNFSAVSDYYQRTNKISDIMGLLYGGQDYFKNHHYWIWDFNSLKDDLINVGFKSVDYWDWRKTEHCHMDDMSQAYLPHMDKDNGTLMSLNVEAVK